MGFFVLGNGVKAKYPGATKSSTIATAVRSIFIAVQKTRWLTEMLSENHLPSTTISSVSNSLFSSVVPARRKELVTVAWP